MGALSFAVVNSAGAFLILLGIALVYGRTGALDMAQIAHALGGRRTGWWSSRSRSSRADCW